MEHWQWEEEQDRREVETFRRFNRLKKAGYVIAWERDVEDAMFLDHLGTGPSLIFYPSGMIVSLDKSAPISSSEVGDTDRISNRKKSDVAAFDQWLDTVTRPTWWQRGAPDREKYIYQPSFTLILLLVWIGLWKLVEVVWNWFVR